MVWSGSLEHKQNVKLCVAVKKRKGIWSLFVHSWLLQTPLIFLPEVLKWILSSGKYEDTFEGFLRRHKGQEEVEFHVKKVEGEGDLIWAVCYFVCCSAVWIQCWIFFVFDCSVAILNMYHSQSIDKMNMYHCIFSANFQKYKTQNSWE